MVRAFSRQRAFFFFLKSAPSSRRLMHFVAAALQKVPIRALQLGDKTSMTGILHVIIAGCRRARRVQRRDATSTLWGDACLIINYAAKHKSCTPKQYNPVPLKNHYQRNGTDAQRERGKGGKEGVAGSETRGGVR